MELEAITETVVVKPRVLRAAWNTEQTGFFRLLRKSDCKYKPYKQGKKRTIKQCNKIRLTNLLVKRHNNLVTTNRVEWKIASSMADEIRQEIDNEILANILKLAQEQLNNE